MRTITKNVYTVAELSEKAFARALRDYAEGCAEIPWQEETIESLKACIAAAGLELRDWSIGAYNRGNGLTLRDFNGEDLAGARAWAWLENNLLAGLRVPWTGKGRWSVAKYGTYYRPGLVKPCPFTGYCADEDMIDALRDAIRGGATIREAFEGLADVARRLLEAEWEHQTSEEGFRDMAEANEWEFDEAGACV